MYRLNDMHDTPLDSKYAATGWRREGRHRGSPDRVQIWTRSGGVRPIPLESTERGFAEEWIDFHAAVTTGSQPAGTAEEALMDLAVIDAGIRSAAEGCSVRL